VRRGVVGVVALLLLVLAQPLESMLRAQAPPAPPSARVGAGRLLGSVLTGTFRPLLLTYLWIRSDILYGQGRYDEQLQVYRTIHRLYPNNPQAREFIGWSLAFNLKSEAPTRELGWRWAREGLGILLEVDGGEPVVSDWIRKQCGQNPVYGLRYAGPEWEDELWWRERLRNWGERRFGERESRFAVALRLLEGRDGVYDVYDQFRRGHLLELATYENLIRTNVTPRADETLRALRDLAELTSDNPGLQAAYLQKIALIEALRARRIPESADTAFAYPVGVALWCMGVRDRNAHFLEAAHGIVSRYEDTAEERAQVENALAWLRAGGRAPRPSLPLDGIE